MVYLSRFKFNTFLSICSLGISMRTCTCVKRRSASCRWTRWGGWRTRCSSTPTCSSCAARRPRRWPAPSATSGPLARRSARRQTQRGRVAQLAGPRSAAGRAVTRGRRTWRGHRPRGGGGASVPAACPGAVRPVAPSADRESQRCRGRRSQCGRHLRGIRVPACGHTSTCPYL